MYTAKARRGGLRPRSNPGSNVFLLGFRRRFTDGKPGTSTPTETTEACDSSRQTENPAPITGPENEAEVTNPLNNIDVEGLSGDDSETSSGERVLTKTEKSAASDGTDKPTQTSTQARGWIRSCFLDPISSFCSSRPVFTGVAGTLATGAALWYLDSCLGGSSVQDHALKDSVIVPAATGFVGSSAKVLGDFGSSVWSHLPEASAVRDFGANTTGATVKAAKSGLSAIYHVPSRLLAGR